MSRTDYAIVKPSQSFSAVETMLDELDSSATVDGSSTNQCSSLPTNAKFDESDPIGVVPADTLHLASKTSPPPSSSNLADATKNRKAPTMKRAVSFNQVEVREYARCLGNNPATTHGPPVSIDWQYERKSSLPVDLYEEERPSQERRTISQLQMPSTVREAMLRQHTDCTKQDIAKAVQQTRKARHERQLTIAMQNYEPWQLVFESLQRRWARWTKRRPSKKREMEMLWETAQNLARTKEDELVTASYNFTGSTSMSGDDKISAALPSSISQKDGGGLLQVKDRVDSTTDDEEDEHNVYGKEVASKTTSTAAHRNSKGFVVVGEDGATIVDDPLSYKNTNENIASTSTSSVGQVVVVQKSPRRKPGLFGRPASNCAVDVKTMNTTTGAIVEC